VGGKKDFTLPLVKKKKKGYWRQVHYSNKNQSVSGDHKRRDEKGRIACQLKKPKGNAGTGFTESSKGKNKNQKTDGEEKKKAETDEAHLRSKNLSKYGRKSLAAGGR